MRNLLNILILILCPIILLASGINDFDDKKKKKKRKKGKEPQEIRAQRNIALTLDGGWNTVGANGIMGTYYVNPKVGIDAGVGIGFKGTKVGVRGKYMLSRKNFSPFIGLGLSARFLDTGPVPQNIEVEQNGSITFESLTYQSTNAMYIKPAIGFEYMSNGGFVIGLATGYAIVTNQPYEILAGESESIETAINLLWGNGIILSFNIGYAF